MSFWFRGVVIATTLVTGAFVAASGAEASLPKHATRLTVRAGRTVTNVDASLLAGGAISGQVTDVDSNPLSGATVEVLTAAGQVAGYTSTDSNGDYRAVGLPPSSKGYAVCVNGANASSTLRPVGYGYVAQCNGSAKAWDGFKPPSDARFVSTAVSQTSTANLILIDGGAVTGTVTSRANGDEVDASGSLFSLSGRGEGGFSVSDGVYAASDLAPGRYVVCFSPDTAPSKGHAGFVPQCYHNTPWPPDSSPPKTAKTVTVTSDAATEVDQSLPAGAAITGKVRNSRTHSPTSAAIVVAFAHGRTLSLQSPGTHGTYDLQNLPVETVDVCAIPVSRDRVFLPAQAQRRAERSVSATWSNKISWSSRLRVDATKAAKTGQCWKHTPWNGKDTIPKAARELHLHRNETTSGIDLAVTPPTYHSHITGHIRDSNGGLKGAGVTAYLSNGRFVAYVTSGKGGAYRLSVPASTKTGYLVCAGPAQEIPQRADARRDPSQVALSSRCWRNAAWNGSDRPPANASKVKVASGHTTSGIDITLPKTGALAGTATYQGSPVPNVTVTAFDQHGDFLGFGDTNAQGRYKIADLSPAHGYLVCFNTEDLDAGGFNPDYGLRPQCYSNQPWDGFSD